MNSTVASADDPGSERTGEPASASSYAVTVILPCRNERDSIERCVRSILSQERPKGNLEVIVVDGLSEDGTPELLARLAQEYPSLKVLIESRADHARRCEHRDPGCTGALHCHHGRA